MAPEVSTADEGRGHPIFNKRTLVALHLRGIRVPKWADSPERCLYLYKGFYCPCAPRGHFFTYINLSPPCS